MEQQPAKKRRGPASKLGKILINLIVTAVVGFLYFYVALPPINLQSSDFYTFIGILCVVYVVSALITSGMNVVSSGGGPKEYLRFIKTQCLPVGILFLALIAVAIVGSILSMPLFRAAAYRDLLTVEDGNFAEDIAEISFSEIPTLDADSANFLGDRQMGTLSDMVSQFEYSNDSTQINYQGRPVRVAPIAYADLIKWFTNRSQGLPAYVIVDMVTQEATVVRLEEGMKYSFSEPLNRNIVRHLRFQYPTYMFGTPQFEIDEDGRPWWIAPRVVKTIGLFGGTDIKGAVLVDAITGESTYYEEVPTWVDNVYTPELIMEQYDYHGTLVNGFINSIFGQRDVTVTTQGSNYIALNDDVVYRRHLRQRRPVQPGFPAVQPAHQGDQVLYGARRHREGRSGFCHGRGAGSWVYSHLPPVAQYRWRAHLLHPPEGQYQPGQELRHGQCGPIPDRGHRLHRLRV